MAINNGFKSPIKQHFIFIHLLFNKLFPKFSSYLSASSDATSTNLQILIFLLQNLLFISICSKRNFRLYINNKTKKIKEINIRIFKIRCSIWWTRKIIVFLKYSVNTKEEKNYNAPRGNISTHFTTLCYSVCCWINSKAMTLTFR